MVAAGVKHQQVAEHYNVHMVTVSRVVSLLRRTEDVACRPGRDLSHNCFMKSHHFEKGRVVAVTVRTQNRPSVAFPCPKDQSTKSRN